MKKFAALMAGVAAIAMAGVASADTVYQGSTGAAGVNVNGTGAVIAANTANALGLLGPNVSLYTVSGGSFGNIGNESNSDGATFTLKGNVTTDCVYYTGNGSQTIDFQEIGIYASENAGPAAAFDMVAPASVDINTNLAGCNTRNRVTLSKNDIRGLVNNSGAGYDSNVFQANLPYRVVGNYTAGAVGSTLVASQGDKITLLEGANATQAEHGAWKSPMRLRVTIPTPSKALLAGNYEGQLTLAITAF
ncbi:hypothetical protein [Brevundimonas sp. C43]|uniref:hypothetical protein n=1 Tax=Brevundimonas sp. C43 TaxID=3068314 RepID=UPI00273D77A3|nr:hypothetical protein [Brevundimonas sp. C43]